MSQVIPSRAAYNSNSRSDAPEGPLSNPSTNYAGRGAFRVPSPGYSPSIYSLESGPTAVSVPLSIS